MEINEFLQRHAIKKAHYILKYMGKNIFFVVLRITDKNKSDINRFFGYCYIF